MNWIVVLALIPLAWRLAVNSFPSQWIEPYAYWDSRVLNSPGADGRLPTWRNVGFWATGNESFSEANEALARKLFEFAQPARNGLVMDIAHGSGDSLLIHLESNPKRLVALTSLPHETEQAQNLVADYLLEQHGGRATLIDWYTASASYRPNKDFEHPLHPMRGFTGGAGGSEEVGEDDDNEQAVLEATKEQEQAGPEPYDLITILDAVYHFPPERGAFLHSLLPSLRKGGVVAYTDFIAPASLSQLPYSLLAKFAAAVLRVPPSNLTNSPKTLDAYKAGLQGMGYRNVKIEDWSGNVWRGIAGNLRARGGVWAVLAWAAEQADKAGWKYVAVRAER